MFKRITRQDSSIRSICACGNSSQSNVLNNRCPKTSPRRSNSGLFSPGTNTEYKVASWVNNTHLRRSIRSRFACQLSPVAAGSISRSGISASNFFVHRINSDGQGSAPTSSRLHRGTYRARYSVAKATRPRLRFVPWMSLAERMALDIILSNLILDLIGHWASRKSFNDKIRIPR